MKNLLKHSCFLKENEESFETFFIWKENEKSFETFFFWERK